MISAGSLAIGIIVTSLTTGMTTDVSSYMFGSILAMSREDMYLRVPADHRPHEKRIGKHFL